MALPIYSSKDVKVNWLGAPLTGFSSDTFITFSYNSDNTDEKVGADGQYEISVSPDSTGTCTLTLLQESEGNLILSGAQNALKLGTVVSGTLTITDPSGSVLAVLRDCHIKTATEVNLAATTQDRSWTFFVGELWFASIPKEVSKVISDSDSDRIVGLIDTLKSNTLI